VLRLVLRVLRRAVVAVPLAAALVFLALLEAALRLRVAAAFFAVALRCVGVCSAMCCLLSFTG